MLEKILGAVFILSLAAMLFFGFFWPLLINNDPSDQALRAGSLLTFGIYITCVIGRLVLRNQHAHREN